MTSITSGSSGVGMHAARDSVVQEEDVREKLYAVDLGNGDDDSTSTSESGGSETHLMEEGAADVGCETGEADQVDFGGKKPGKKPREKQPVLTVSSKCVCVLSIVVVCQAPRLSKHSCSR